MPLMRLTLIFIQNKNQNIFKMEITKSLLSEYWKIIVIVILLCVILLMRKCEPNPSYATVTIPEKKGVFKPEKPTHKEVVKFKDKIVYKDGINSVVENPLNEILLKENEILKDQFKVVDSVNKILLYEKAIQINQFSTKFEDDNLLLNIEGLVRGEVQEITPSYTIKEKKIQVPEKSVVFRFSGGLEVGNNLQLDKLSIKGNLGLQGKKGDIYTISYDDQKNIWIGFQKSIFSIKK